MEKRRKHPARAPADPRKWELECLRLELDCRQLADASASASLRSHFMKMAGNWSALAAWGLEHGYRGQALN